MSMNNQLTAVVLCAVCFVAAASAQTTQPLGVQTRMKDVRYVVLHRPGPAWIAGKSMFEQAGVRAHVEHYRAWLESGKLYMGGPHLDAAGGGMMIPSAGVSEGEVQAFAAADPAVKDGTLIAEVRPWLIGMSQ
jgi:uncharacterized protein YciI